MIDAGGNLYRRLRRLARISLDWVKYPGARSFLRSLVSAKKLGPLRLIFDHRMGGGSNFFVRQLIGNAAANNEGSSLIVTIGLDDRQIHLDLHIPGKVARHRPKSIDAAFTLLRSACANEIVVNGLVTWPRPAEMSMRIRDLSIQCSAVLTIYVHDYFFLCPSVNLLNFEGNFCKLPDDDVCSACLKRHPSRFVRDADSPNIVSWRNATGGLMHQASKIVCFSESSATLLRQGYREKQFRIEVVPHEVHFKPERLPIFSMAAPLRIGILGNIDLNKGAVIVDGLARLIAEKRIDATITILGNYRHLPALDLVVHGSYNTSELVSLIEHYGLNIFLFPSIVPETFSYVCSEIMSLKMPLVAFNLGAQGERVNKYHLGLLAREITSEAALQGILQLRARLTHSDMG